DWLRRAYRLAQIVPQRRGMWHSIRRKRATERKGYPVKDVAAAGGWKTEEVLVTSYQQADAETIKNVVLRPTHRIVCREKLTAELTARDPREFLGESRGRSLDRPADFAAPQGYYGQVAGGAP